MRSSPRQAFAALTSDMILSPIQCGRMIHSGLRAMRTEPLYRSAVIILVGSYNCVQIWPGLSA
jgi:hypothetical protein